MGKKSLCIQLDIQGSLTPTKIFELETVLHNKINEFLMTIPVAISNEKVLQELSNGV